MVNIEATLIFAWISALAFMSKWRNGNLKSTQISFNVLHKIRMERAFQFREIWGKVTPCFSACSAFHRWHFVFNVRSLGLSFFSYFYFIFYFLFLFFSKLWLCELQVLHLKWNMAGIFAAEINATQFVCVFCGSAGLLIRFSHLSFGFQCRLTTICAVRFDSRNWIGWDFTLFLIVAKGKELRK